MTERNKIVYGQWTFSDDDIHNGNVYVTISLMSDALEANTFTATVECSDKSILDFERNSPLTYFSLGKQIGVFYVQSITREGPTTYTISATSAIGFLIEGLHYGGIYTGQTVAEVLPSICGTVPYVVKTNLRETALYGWLPVASPRDNLSQVLFAIGAVIKTDLDGVLHIEGLWDGISGTFGQDRMYMGPSVDYESKVTQVVVTEHQYIEGGEETNLFEGTAQDGDIITFDEPMHNLQATGITILESGANYAKVSSGSGTLTGTAYVHNTRQVTEDVLQANEPNVKTVTEATLVSLVNSRAVAQRIANYYKSYQTINADAVYQGEAPGDLLSTWHPYDQEAVSACLESADISMSNTLKASEELLIGFVPPQIQEEEILENRVVLTGQGVWEIPSGVTNFVAVLIGGGANGQEGSDGTVGTVYRSQSDYGSQNGTLQPGSSISTSASANASSGTAGEGGDGGQGGSGGKILRVEVNVSGQTSISYNCGVAVEYGGTSETVFGEYTSANGSTSELGYTDPITGELFATPGNAGRKGGNGGSPGEDGEDAGSASGGQAVTGGTINDSDSASRTTGTANDDGTVTNIWLTYSVNATFRIGNGGGGGAGGNGENGGSAVFDRAPTCSVNNRGMASAYGYSIAGGDGGNGGNGEDGKNYGCGGDGGHGGGGAGACGSISTSATCVGKNESISQGNFGDSISIYVSAATARSSAGSGGLPGAGKDGCVIVYYGVPKVVESGPIVTSQNKYFLDKYGRKVVV